MKKHLECFFADIKIFGDLPQMEMEKIEFFDEFPKNWMYPLIQLYLFKKLQEFKKL